MENKHRNTTCNQQSFKKCELNGNKLQLVVTLLNSPVVMPPIFRKKLGGWTA